MAYRMGVEAGRRFAATQDPQKVYQTLQNVAARYGRVTRGRPAQRRSPQRAAVLLSSLSRRTTESSRRRALRRALRQYGQTIQPQQNPLE